MRNIREVIELCLENRASGGWELPEGYEVVQISVDAQENTAGASQCASGFCQVQTRLTNIQESRPAYFAKVLVGSFADR